MDCGLAGLGLVGWAWHLAPRWQVADWQAPGRMRVRVTGGTVEQQKRTAVAGLT